MIEHDHVPTLADVGKTVHYFAEEGGSPIFAAIVHLEEFDDNGRVDIEFPDGERVDGVPQNSNDDPDGPFWKFIP